MWICGYVWVTIVRPKVYTYSSHYAYFGQVLYFYIISKTVTIKSEPATFFQKTIFSNLLFWVFKNYNSKYI